MKPTLKLFYLTLLLAVLISACSPAGTATPLPAPVSTVESQAGVTQPAPLATSRGDQLAASLPASVKYGAGRPVLVEFFRFT